MLKIVNIVASGSFNQMVDLYALSAIGDRYKYDPDVYHGGYIQLSSVKVTVYRTGKYILTGIKSLDSLSSLWEELVSILFIHLDVSLFEPPEIKNIVAQTDLGFLLKLGKLIVHLKDENAEYEPEFFSGLIWKTKFGTANISQNGKIMLLGCRSVEQLEKLQAYVVERVKEI